MQEDIQKREQTEQPQLQEQSQPKEQKQCPLRKALNTKSNTPLIIILFVLMIGAMCAAGLLTQKLQCAFDLITKQNNTIAHLRTKLATMATPLSVAVGPAGTTADKAMDEVITKDIVDDNIANIPGGRIIHKAQKQAPKVATEDDLTVMRETEENLRKGMQLALDQETMLEQRNTDFEQRLQEVENRLKNLEHMHNIPVQNEQTMQQGDRMRNPNAMMRRGSVDQAVQKAMQNSKRRDLDYGYFDSHQQKRNNPDEYPIPRWNPNGR